MSSGHYLTQRAQRKVRICHTHVQSGFEDIGILNPYLPITTPKIYRRQNFALFVPSVVDSIARMLVY